MLRLKEGLGLSDTAVSRSVRIARSTVKEYLNRAAAVGLNWEAVAELSEEALDRRRPGLPKGWSSERLLMASGVPVLIIPDGWKSETIGNNILFGWNASREARRAMADAMPFLSAAQSVTVLVVDPGKRADEHGEEPGADIALCLARHGAHVDVEQARSDGSPIGEVILSRAVGRGVDLIVIGAYSYPRWAEIIFGGVTRTLLTQLPVPVLASR